MLQLASVYIGPSIRLSVWFTLSLIHVCVDLGMFFSMWWWSST